MKRIAEFGLLFVCVATFLSGPAAGGEKVVLLDECKYSSAEAARAQWKPVEKGCPPVGVGTVGGKAALKLPCNFSGNQHWRLIWQREGKWDLSACQNISLDITTDRGRPALMLLYLRSGSGWYRRWVGVPAGTNTITLPRVKFEKEDKPAGWDKITAVRLVVRRDEVDRTILVSRICGLHRKGDALVDVLGLLAEAETVAGEAKSTMKPDDATKAAGALAKARRAYQRAYAAGIPSKPGEFRAVWCHDPKGCRGMTWDQAMKTLADAGFNAIIVNMSWGDAAAHKSKVLPLAKRAEGRDQLAECAAAGKKHGIAVHAWKCNLRCHNRSSQFYKDLCRQGRLMQNYKGETVKYALCPTHPANIKLEVDSMVEMARDYDTAGIHFDYIRFPGDETCYCPHCRKQFEQEYKVKVKNWPADVRNGPLTLKYQQFRRDRITNLVAAVNRAAHKVKPDTLVSAAVFWHWPSARVEVAQDWKLWVEKGYLDFVCPMLYVPMTGDFEGQMQSVSQWVGGRVPLMPGIGAVLGISPEETLRRIVITRKHKTAGFVLFQYRPPLPQDYLPLLKSGATAKKTKWTPPKRKTDRK